MLRKRMSIDGIGIHFVAAHELCMAEHAPSIPLPLKSVIIEPTTSALRKRVADLRYDSIDSIMITFP